MRPLSPTFAIRSGRQEPSCYQQRYRSPPSTLLGEVLRPLDPDVRCRIHLRNDLIICQDVFPGNRHSQKIHPFVGLPVIATAAADGES